MTGFTVPIHLKDLELPTSNYVVNEAVASAPLPSTAAAQKAEVARLKAAIENEGAPAVVEHFDAPYGVASSARVEAELSSAFAPVPALDRPSFI